MGKIKKTQEKAFLSQLEKNYTENYQAITGVPKPMAKRFIKTVITQIVKESKLDGTSSLPPDCGERMIENAATDETAAKELEKLKIEGVTEEDIIGWWGLHDFERRLLMKLDETNRAGLYLKLTTIDKMPGSEANKLVQQYHPIYGDPSDRSQYKGEDRPLPPELRKRVTSYMERETKRPIEEQRKKLEQFSSLNARIRHEIREANI